MLIESVNWDLDYSGQRMSSWEFLQEQFHSPIYIKTLFIMKTIPFLGNYMSNILFNHISNIYDVVSSYIEAHKIVEDLCLKFPLDEKVIDKINSESEDNRQSGEDYIKFYINISFPEIQAQIHNKKAAFTVLENLKRYTLEKFQQGQLDDKEYI